MYAPDVNVRKGKSRQYVFLDMRDFVRSMYIIKVPSYGNSVFYSLGFLLLITFAVLVVSGIVMVFFGPFWWDANPAGVFVRSIHLWAAQAFLLIMALHLLTVFSTSAFREKKLIWMVGAAMFLLILLQSAFGLGIRGDFVSQWNDLSAADLWNGSGLGYWINPINFGALYGWHVAIIPIVLVTMMGMHYMMVKKKGISKPYRNDIPYTMVYADHRKMYVRGLATVALIVVFAFLFRAPYVSPITIQNVSQSDPGVMAATLLAEFNYSSGTATYLDTIDPYNSNTRQTYVTIPYGKYLQLYPNSINEESVFYTKSSAAQQSDINGALVYFDNGGTINTSDGSANPLIPIVSSLVLMGRSGLYDAAINSESGSYLDSTYQLRFLADTGVMGTYATKYNLQYEQWGVIKGSSGWWPPGVWLAAPYNLLEVTVLNNDPNQDRDGMIIASASFILFIIFPFIPFANEIPDRLKMYKLFWNRFTIPEYRKPPEKKPEEKTEEKQKEEKEK